MDVSIFIDYILGCSRLQLFLLLYAPRAVKISLIGRAFTNFRYYYYLKHSGFINLCWLVVVRETWPDIL